LRAQRARDSLVADRHYPTCLVVTRVLCAASAGSAQPLR